jgi:hypothetical protein
MKLKNNIINDFSDAIIVKIEKLENQKKSVLKIASASSNGAVTHSYDHKISLLLSFKSIIKSAENDISLIKNISKEEYDSGINAIEEFIEDIRKESLSQKKENLALSKEIDLVYFDVKKSLSRFADYYSK